MSDTSHETEARTSSPELDVAAPNVLEGQQARRTLNARAWACRLPHEMLGEIFLYVQAKDEDDNDRGWYPRRLPPENGSSIWGYDTGWMSITYVCSTWRKVALAMPMLWRNLSVLNTPPALAKDFLKRSAGLPLRLTYDEFDEMIFEGKEISSAQEEINAQCMQPFFTEPVFRRLETLIGCFVKMGEAQAKLLTHEAPKVHTLSMVNDGPPFVLFNLLGPTCPPNLRKLGLSNFTLPMSFAPLPPTLTHLKLMGTRLLTDKRRSPAAQALSVLSTLTALEYLHLSNFPQSDVTTSDQSLEKLLLPETLRYMAVHIYTDWKGEPPAFEAAVELAGYLVAPPTAERRSSLISALDFEPLVCRQLLAGVGADICRANSLLELQLRSPRACCLHRRDPETHERSPGVSTNLELTMDFDFMRIRPADLLRALPSPPRFVTVLSSYWPKTAGQDVEIYNEKSDILLLGQEATCLTVYYSDHAHLWRLLCEDPAQFARLETLVLSSIDYACEYSNESAAGGYEVYFHEDECGEYEDEVDVGVLPELVAGLREAAVARRRSGARMWKVRIEGEALTEWDGWDQVSDVVDIERQVYEDSDGSEESEGSEA